MTSGWTVAVEVGIIEGSVLLFAGWELLKLRRERRTADKPTAESEAEFESPDDDGAVSSADSD